MRGSSFRPAIADYAVITEPSDLRVQRVGNGLTYFEVVFSGVAAHGSTPESGHSAVFDAAAFIEMIEREGERMSGDPHPLTGPATYNVGVVDGGIDTSIVPDRCRVVVDRRVVPGQTTRGAIDDMDRILRDLDLLAPMAAQRLVGVALSVTSLDPAIARTLEPRAPSAINVYFPRSAMPGV